VHEGDVKPVFDYSNKVQLVEGIVIEIDATLVVHPLKRWIAFLLEPQENLLAAALQFSTGVGVGVGLGIGSPNFQW